MKSALFIISFFIAGLFPVQVLATEPVEHDAQCVAVYINGIGVPNGGTYPAYITPGSSFKAEIKVKNTGTRVWKATDGYKLGINQDSVAWGASRALLPSDRTQVESNQEVIFAINGQATSALTNGKSTYSWQMLRERTVQDPGGRFGQVCSVGLIVGQNQDLPKTDTSPQVESQVSKPDVTTSTVCTDIQKGLQSVKASWTGYSASSVRVFLKDGASLVDSSACLGSGTQSYIFSKTVPASAAYKVSVLPFQDSACGRLDLNAPTGGYLSDVTNGGFTNPKNYTDPSIFHLKNMFIEIGNVRSKFNFESCAPTSYILPIPAGKTALHSFDVPINILLTRFATGTNGTVQRNDINSKYPVIIRYRPVLSGSEGETFKAPVSPAPRTSVPGTTQEVGEP